MNLETVDFEWIMEALEAVKKVSWASSKFIFVEKFFFVQKDQNFRQKCVFLSSSMDLSFVFLVLDLKKKSMVLSLSLCLSVSYILLMSSVDVKLEVQSSG